MHAAVRFSCSCFDEKSLLDYSKVYPNALSDQGTVTAVLDTMVEPVPSSRNTYNVHYSVLDADKHGQTPNHSQRKRRSDSTVDKIAREGKTVDVLHIFRSTKSVLQVE